MDDDFFKRGSNHLQKCLESHRIKCQKNAELTKVVNELKEELSLSNRAVAHYKEVLETFSKTESCTALYNSLKKKSTEIHNENCELRQRLLSSEENFAGEKQKIINDYEDKIAKLVAKYAEENEALTSELHKKIHCCEAEIADLKKAFEIKENYVNNQIQLCQASADLQVDEAEVKWKTLLDSVNQKQKESNSTCFNLRNQIITLRNQVASHKNEIDKLTHEKKDTDEKLVYTENQLISAQEKLLQNQHSSVKKYSGGKHRFSNNLRASIYKVKENGREHIDHPNQANSSRVSNASQEKNMDYENLRSVQGLYKTKHNVRLLPLQPRPPENKGNASGRKRKLFNPDSTEYLNEMENQD